MIGHTEQLIARYSQKGLLIDTNILLLLFIGSYDQNLIRNFKRTVQFTIEDYDLLVVLLRPFNKLVTTPNILTEVTNLSGQLGEPARSSYFRTFAEGIKLLEEEYVESQKIAGHAEFVKIGLTDVGIWTVSEGNYLVLTDDFKLSQLLGSKGVDVINFNHLRPLGWT
ncbi:MAG TPA: PIN domain-containing protein [Blastocatellia bacterium]|nr:PIN domain-containing protein [Blastocatellia bacterium]